MELNILNDQGQKAGAVPVVDTVFGTDFNEPLIHQIVVAYQANARSGNRAQKDRSEVRHSTKKALAPERYGSCPCRYDVQSAVAWRRQDLPEQTGRELLSEGQPQDVPCRHAFHPVAAGA